MISVDDLRLQAEKTPEDTLRFKLWIWTVVQPAYTEWCDAVEEAVAQVGIRMSAKRAALKERGEDALSATLAIALNGFGLDAEMMYVNGNCDIVVRHPPYLWIGEAKIDNSPSWIWKGYLQLVSRYATGLPNQDRGGMVVYCYNDALDASMASWRGALCAQLGVDPNSLAAWPHSQHAFCSEDVTAATNRPFKMVHQGIALHHKPLDAVVKLSKSATLAAKAAKARVRKPAKSSNP